MKIKRREIKKARIEIIPMIDVIFFLLVFFMVSSLANQKYNAVKVQLPQTSSSPDSIPQKIILSVKPTGEIYVNKTQVDLHTLGEVLAHSMSDSPDETVIVNADQGASYGTVIRAMDEAKKIGVRKFALSSQYQGIGK